ncbi:MAG: CYTH domain-containing protein [Clostridia bacterium]|nr:CYTH domain-containing protein [Clostridia bacterium]
MNKLEIERKFLIKMPNEKRLLDLKSIRVLNISQTYTTKGERIRKIEENGSITYIKTIKKHISDLVRLEMEEEISGDEYNCLLGFKEGNTIEKTRYVYLYKGKNIEIDIFPFWQSQAFLEVELISEDEDCPLPSFIEVIKEVTEDKAYRNYSLSKNIPKEENF